MMSVVRPAISLFSAACTFSWFSSTSALDEENQAVAAKTLLDAFTGSQVLCVSHHTAFHRRADHLIQIMRDAGSSKFLRAVAQRRT